MANGELATGTATIGTTATEIARIAVPNIDRLILVVRNGATALNSFNVKAQPYTGAQVWTLASAAGDYSSPNGVTILLASGTPVTLGASGDARIVMNPRGIKEIFFDATVAAGSSILTYYLTGS